ncbi:M23 family metallopeptidase [Sphingomonas sp. MMS24-JH45]
MSRVPGSEVDVARPTGTPVVAPADGVVVLTAAAPFTLKEGRLLILDHGNGLSSAFLRVRIAVAEGQHVRRGDTIGAIGATGGAAAGPHLHWGMVWRGRRIDPAAVLAKQGRCAILTQFINCNSKRGK